MEIVDARGLPCPQPVIRTRDAMEKNSEVVTIVDSETAQMNVTRMAEKSGAVVEAEKREDGIRLTITRDVETEEDSKAEITEGSPQGPSVLLVSSELMGRGEHDELGYILMRGFFHTLGEVDPVPDTVIFLNSGVKLVVAGSPVVEDLQALVDQGIEILACGTCLGYYELKDDIVVGEISNMYTIVETMLAAGRLITV